MQAKKEALREVMRVRRAGLHPSAVSSAGRRVSARLACFRLYLAADTLVAYVAKDNEVPLDGLIEDALARGKRVYLPSLESGWFREHDGRGRSGPEGLHEPLGQPLATAACGLVLVPLLAWSPAGERLGRGGGWYDRLLPRLRLPSVGVGYDFQRCEDLPTETTDISLDYIATESCLCECRERLSAACT